MAKAALLSGLALVGCGARLACAQGSVAEDQVSVAEDQVEDQVSVAGWDIRYTTPDTVRIANGTAGYVPLPQLADNFEAVIEANIYNRGYTIHMHEWHDVDQDAGRTDMYSRRGGTSNSVVYDYGNNRYFNTGPTGCTWGDMDHVSGRRGFMGGNDGHVTSSARLMGLEDRAGMDYTGLASARGIMCDTWTDNSERGVAGQGNHSKMVLKFYFAHASWSIPEDNFERVPVRVELEGIREQRNRTTRGPAYNTPGDPSSGVSTHEYYHVYDYTSFHVGPVDPAAFARPCGSRCYSANTTWDPTVLDIIGCPDDPTTDEDECLVDNTIIPPPPAPRSWGGGGFGGPPPPPPPPPPPQAALPELPNAFEAKIEANIINKNYTIVMHEWYDYEENKGRTDMYSPARPAGFGRPASPAHYTSSVYDYENNLYYHTTAATQGSLDDCSWGDMDHITGFNMFGAEGDGAHITTTANVINFGGTNRDGSERVETYVGTATVRGIPCDKWINVVASVSNDTGAIFNMTTEYFFSVEGYDIPEAEGVRIPIRFRIFGVRSDVNYTSEIPEVTGMHEFDHIYDYTSFHVGSSPASIFSQPCGVSCYSTNTTWDDTVLDPAPCPQPCTAPNGAVLLPPTVHSGPPPPPTVPSGATSLQITLGADESVIVLGSPQRDQFERDFKSSVAEKFDSVQPADVVIVGISAGSVVVDFYIENEPDGVEDVVAGVTEITTSTGEPIGVVTADPETDDSPSETDDSPSSPAPVANAATGAAVHLAAIVSAAAGAAILF